jgi:uncharacterized protein (TIGR03086 family)
VQKTWQTGGSGRWGDNPAGAYRAAAERVLSAFAVEGVLDRDFPLPEIAPGLPFPARRAIGFHCVDYVAHSWDVARTLDLPLDLDPALLDAAFGVAQAVPGGEARLAPGAAFASVVDWRGGSRLDQIVALLGRSPDWKRPLAPR